MTLSIHPNLKIEYSLVNQEVKKSPFELLEHAFDIIPLCYPKFEIIKYRDEHEKDNFCFEVYQKSMEFVIKREPLFWILRSSKKESEIGVNLNQPIDELA